MTMFNYLISRENWDTKKLKILFPSQNQVMMTPAAMTRPKYHPAHEFIFNFPLIPHKHKEIILCFLQQQCAWQMILLEKSEDGVIASTTEAKINK